MAHDNRVARDAIVRDSAPGAPHRSVRMRLTSAGCDQDRTYRRTTCEGLRSRRWELGRDADRSWRKHDETRCVLGYRWRGTERDRARGHRCRRARCDAVATWRRPREAAGCVAVGRHRGATRLCGRAHWTTHGDHRDTDAGCHSVHHHRHRARHTTPQYEQLEKEQATRNRRAPASMSHAEEANTRTNM